MIVEESLFTRKQLGSTEVIYYKTSILSGKKVYVCHKILKVCTVATFFKNENGILDKCDSGVQITHVSLIRYFLAYSREYFQRN